MTTFTARTSWVFLPLSAAIWAVMQGESVEPAAPSSREPQSRAALETRPLAPSLAPLSDRGDLLRRLAAKMSDFRSGEDVPSAEIDELTKALGEDHGLAEMRELVEFYRGLTKTERRQGLAAAQSAQELSAKLFGEDAAQAVAGLEALRAQAENLADPSALARTLESLAMAAFWDYQEAWSQGVPLDPQAPDRIRSQARKSLELYRRIGQLRPRIQPLFTLGDLEKFLGNLSEARSYYEQVRHISHRVGQTDYREYAVREMVNLAHQTGDHKLIEFSVRDWARFRDPSETWLLAKEYAQLLLHADRPQAAAAFLERNAPGEDAPADVATSHALLEAAILKRQGEIEAAAAAFQRTDADYLDPSLVSLAEADIALAAGEYERVIKLLETAQENYQAQDQVWAQARLGEAWHGRGDSDRARTWLRSALRLAHDYQEQTRAVLAGSIQGEWSGLHSLVRLTTLEGEAGQHLEVARLIEDHQSFDLRWSIDPDAPRGIGIEDLEAWAGRYERGLITWVVGSDDSVVAYVSRDLEAWSTNIPLGRRQIAAAGSRVTQALLDGDEARAEGLAAEISGALIPEDCPLHSLDPAPGQRLLVLVHGPIEDLPISYLRLGERYLDECLTPIILPGLPHSQPEERPARFQRTSQWEPWQLLGGPISENGEVLLPSASREIAALGRVYPSAEVHAGASFDSSALLAALAGNAPLHLATHLVESTACDSPRLAPVGLLLSDGQVFCAQEVLNQRPSLPLVLLTTCDSGMGAFVDAEGLHGLSRAFLEGGTRNLVATLWPIGDQAGLAFSMHLHERLLAGDPPSEATRRARQQLRLSGSAGVDWAAFRFLGQD